MAWPLLVAGLTLLVVFALPTGRVTASYCCFWMPCPVNIKVPLALFLDDGTDELGVLPSTLKSAGHPFRGLLSLAVRESRSMQVAGFCFVSGRLPSSQKYGRQDGGQASIDGGVQVGVCRHCFLGAAVVLSIPCYTFRCGFVASVEQKYCKYASKVEGTP
eukprot:4838077-Amphidinium_carterae.2